MKDNNMKLAEKIFEIENMTSKKFRESGLPGDFASFRKQDSYKLTDDIFMEKSVDCMMWYLWNHHQELSRPFFKAVPRMNFSKATIEKILSDTPWSCI